MFPDDGMREVGRKPDGCEGCEGLYHQFYLVLYSCWPLVRKLTSLIEVA